MWHMGYTFSGGCFRGMLSLTDLFRKFYAAMIFSLLTPQLGRFVVGDITIWSSTYQRSPTNPYKVSWQTRLKCFPLNRSFHFRLARRECSGAALPRLTHSFCYLGWLAGWLVGEPLCDYYYKQLQRSWFLPDPFYGRYGMVTRWETWNKPPPFWFRFNGNKVV